jgi:putative Holliday junction resolvase
MGLDYGSKTVGVAISDALYLTTQSVETITRESENKLRRTLARIEELIKEYDVEKIVLGFPKNMNNTVGPRAEKTLEFKELLEKRTDIQVILWDERLSTLAVDRIMDMAQVRKQDRKKNIDNVAAAYILQAYIDWSKNGGKS